MSSMVIEVCKVSVEVEHIQYTAIGTEEYLCDVRGNHDLPFGGGRKDGTLLVTRQVGVQREDLGLRCGGRALKRVDALSDFLDTR
jgi:hypothetical protein